MPTDQLTAREVAALFVLLAEGRELTNAEMRAACGFALDGDPRRRLNDLKLVTSTKSGRSFVHELTDAGAARCTAELDAERPPRAGYLGGAFYCLLRGLGHTRTPLGELFPGRPDVERQIREAYHRAPKNSGGWVSLRDLRDELAGLARGTVDDELERLAATPGVYVEADSNQRVLTEADHAAAVRFGAQVRHMIMIEVG